MENIIFLDIDGVLTSMDYTPGSYINHLPNEYGLSIECVEKLKRLCNETHSKIVISSNWRKFDLEGDFSYWVYNGHKYKNPLKEMHEVLDGFILGSLPPIRHQKKSLVLKDWLHRNPCISYDFIIFDDDLNEGFQNIDDFEISKKFVHTDYRHGLSDKDCLLAKKILDSMKI